LHPVFFFVFPAVKHLEYLLSHYFSFLYF